MAAAAINSSIFSRFSSLPPELRNQIWHDALPDNDGSVLYPYRKGCWCLRCLSGSDAGYDPYVPANLWLVFCHDLLDHVQVDVPLVFVNREARGIALAWVHEQGIQMRFCEDRECHIFVRSFDPIRDVLYVAVHQFNNFCIEPYDRMFEPDLLNQMFTSDSGLTRIGIPEALLQVESNPLAGLFEWFDHITTLFILVDTQPDFEDNDTKVQRRWEFESRRTRAIFWNRNQSRFDWGEGEYVGDEGLYRRIEELGKEVGKEFLQDPVLQSRVRSFEIRPIFAIRR